MSTHHILTRALPNHRNIASVDWCISKVEVKRVDAFPPPPPPPPPPSLPPSQMVASTSGRRYNIQSSQVPSSISCSYHEVFTGPPVCTHGSPLPLGKGVSTSSSGPLSCEPNEPNPLKCLHAGTPHTHTIIIIQGRY